MSIQVRPVVPSNTLALCNEHHDKQHWVRTHVARKAKPALPIQAGIWKHDDISSGSEVLVSGADEFKYIIQGSITLKDVKTGIEHTAETGSMLWIEEGSQAIIIKSENLVAVYIEIRDEPEGVEVSRPS